MSRITLAALALPAALICTGALAGPALEVRQIGGATLSVPVGWSVQQSAQPVPTIQIEEKAGAADSPSVTLMTVPLQNNPQTVQIFAQQLLQTAMPARRQTGRQQAADGSLMTEWAGAIGGIPAMMAMIQRADTASGMGVVAVFAAPTARYTELGGPKLLLQVLSGQPTAGVAAGPPPPTRAVPTPVAGGLKIPAAYTRSSTPTLNYLVDTLEALSPAQVAQGMRQLNPTEVQLLGIYGSFANLLHFIGCRADGALVLPPGAGCARTAAGWKQTLQFVNNDWEAATTQARSERAKLQIAARCGDGRHDAATCATYTKTVGEMNRANHETMMQVIRNLDGSSCQLGEPGCVPR